MIAAEHPVKKYMTSQPHYVESKEPVANAQALMAHLSIRHLPVLEKKEIIGIISDRDIKMATSLVESEARLLLVRDICHENPYIVDEDMLLRDVVRYMSDARYGCAIVSRDKRLTGIFTTVDACRILSDILETRLLVHH